MSRLERAKRFFARQLAVGKVLAREKGIDVTLTPEDVNDALSNVTIGGLKDGDDFTAGKQAQKGVRIMYDNKMYICLQSHITMVEWNPKVAPALWSLEKSKGDAWVQPKGAHDAYSIGDIVSHLGKQWLSLVNGNVWEPSVYGWEEV